MKYIIVGYGKFGRIALERIRSAFPEMSVIVVEHDPSVPAPSDTAHVTVVRNDAVSFLSESNMLEPDDLIIPMVPIHLAAHYVLSRCPGTAPVPIWDKMGEMLPNPIRLDTSTLVCSRANFVCPDDCPEGRVCTVTGREIDTPLYAVLEQIEAPGFKVLVQRSFQVLPGVGGYSFGDLIELAAEINEGTYMIATSCKCHGIITAVGYKPGS